MLRFVFKNKEEEGEGKETRTFWIYAFGEFVLVFLGILIALQVDNWNQDRRVKNLEKAMLHELLANLNSDLADVELNINRHKRAVVSSEIALAFIDGDEPWHDSLASHYGNLQGGTIFYKNISSYESLKSLGIDLISTDSLRQLITHLYSVSYDLITYLEKLAFTHTYETLNARIAEHIYRIDDSGKGMPLNVSELKESNELRHNLITYRDFRGYLLSEYNAVKGEIQSMIKNIEKELS